MSGLPPPTSASSKLNATEGLIYPPFAYAKPKNQSSIRPVGPARQSWPPGNLAARKRLAQFSALKMFVEGTKRALKASKY